MSDSTSNFVPYGRYLLERRLAVGGMAEVFLGRLPGPQAFTKQVVVKRLLGHLADDHDAVGSFLDEAKLAARFTHPNLIQVFELAQIDGQYCIVMEYLEGVDLAQLLDACAFANMRVPPPIAALLVARSAEALDYVHRLTGEDGRALSIVHADISPANIVLTRQGEVKVVDFGVAKHAGARTGVVRGKASYMAPEQMAGSEIDARADVFALGVVLYELLTGVRLFPNRVAPDELETYVDATLDALADSTHLTAVIRCALRLSPTQRTQSAADVQRGLEGYLATVPRPLAADVATFARSLPQPSSPNSPLRTVVHDSTHTVHGRYSDPRVPMRPETVALIAREEASPSRSGFRAVHLGLMLVGLTVLLAGVFAVGLWRWSLGETRRAPERLEPVLAQAAPEKTAAAAPESRTEPAATVAPGAGAGAGAAAAAAAAAAAGTVAEQASERPLKKARDKPRQHGAAVIPPVIPVKAPAPATATAGAGAGATATATAAQAPVLGSGRVAFIVEPWAHVYLGDRQIGTTPMAPVTLPEGHYEFRLVSPDTGRERTVGVNVVTTKTSKVVETLR